MNEWSGRLLSFAKLRWPLANRAVPLVIGAAAVVAAVIFVAGGARPAMVPLFGVPISEENDLHQIATRLDLEAISYQISDDGRIYVADDRTAQRLRVLLLREGLIPSQPDPYSFFRVDRFSRTDFERNVNLQRADTVNLEQQLRAIDNIDAASVTLVVPERRLFSEEQKPATASVVITPHPASDLSDNRKKIVAIRRLIANAVEGLELHNIVILDNRGNQLSRPLMTFANDFSAIDDFDRIELTERQLQTELALEQSYKREVLDSLSRIFTRDRVQIIRLDIDLNLDNQRTETEEQLAIANDAASWRSIIEENSPWSFRRVTVAVAIDGIWRRLYDRRGNIILEPDASIAREYTKVSDEELAAAHRIIVNTVGFETRRGDSVTVEHLPFDRSEQFRLEDASYRRRTERNRVLALGGAVAAAVLIAFTAARLEVFRRWRMSSDRVTIQQADRESVVSVKWGRNRASLQRQATTMSRRHPAEVARVLRTWLEQR